jgi:hypothetical protein
MDDVQVAAACEEQADVDTFCDAVADELPEASRATTPNV